jgi:putative transposase
MTDEAVSPLRRRMIEDMTIRVAIANSRLIACDQRGVTFKWKDYRIEGRDRYKQMTLATDEFIRRFLIQRAARPHPPLRPVRQGRLRQQHRTSS